jgi:cysteine sulfinate desulfinase/cysteine desulfurase-like protein
VQPIAQIAAEAKQRGVLVHSDAAQSIGKVAVDVQVGLRWGGCSGLQPRAPAARLQPAAWESGCRTCGSP